MLPWKESLKYGSDLSAGVFQPQRICLQHTSLMSVNKAKPTVLIPTLSIIKDSKLDLAVSPFESNQIKLCNYKQ